MLTHVLDVAYLESRPLGGQVREADRNELAVGKDVALPKLPLTPEPSSERTLPNRCRPVRGGAQQALALTGGVGAPDGRQAMP